MCQIFTEGVVVNDFVNEVVVVNDSANSCETDQDTSQSRVCKSNAICSNIEKPKSGQTINTEAIQALSDSLVHITEVIAKLQENMNKSRQNTELQVENEPNYMQERTAEQELNFCFNAQNIKYLLN
ncbi:Hypothetical predicted protein [Paramuricea clavata]|uniref:Uncharacterized protein n=1 Tax=Paramuricea clavata TaxID=317549 RepID=A0A6S7JVZ4_PARCT|nr:Hypothetical predicted protein [Paramuricea clavata]